MSKSGKVDFHLHSNISDGIFSPEEIIKITAEAGLLAAGLTDHDTVNGLNEAALAAAKYSIELIPGVEISVIEDDHEVHILGYYPQQQDQLNEALTMLQKERFVRMEAVVEKLNRLGLKISPDEVINEAGEAAPGRLHIARLLRNKKYIRTLNQAFTTYLNKNRPAYVPRQTFSLNQVMNLLADVGALPVIAHPGARSKNIIEKLISMGLKGVEVFHPDHSHALVKYYLELAQSKGLIITGGSDFHGESRQKINYPAYLAISADYLKQMKLVQL